MDNPRSERVAGLLRRELADILQRHFEHELPAGLISLTDVEVSRDLAHARVYIAVLEIEQAGEVIAFLNHHAGQVRHELSRRVRLRFTPEVKFIHDTSSESGERIERLLAAARGKGR